MKSTSKFVPIDHEMATSYNPTTVESPIYEWWEKNKTQLVKDYEQKTYPGGSVPELGELKDDLPSRQAWLETLIIASTFTMGRTTPQQKQWFLNAIALRRNCRGGRMRMKTTAFGTVLL